METIIQKIRELLPPQSDYGSDEVIITGNGINGDSIKFVYWRLVHEEQNNNDDGWRSIWNLKIQDHMKTFVWLLRHDRLLTNQQKSLIGLDEA